jgi:hypothetical protein
MAETKQMDGFARDYLAGRAGMGSKSAKELCEAHIALTAERQELRAALAAVVAWDDASNAQGTNGDTDWSGLDATTNAARALLAKVPE